MQSHDASTYFVGIDVASRAEHVAAIVDDRGQTIGKKFTFGHAFDDLHNFRRQVRKALPQGAHIVWGCEATGASWRCLAAYFHNQGETFSLENAATVADLRKVNSRHFKTDHIDARTIAETLRMRLANGRALRTPPAAEVQAQRSLLRRIEALSQEQAQTKNRIINLLCDSILPGLNPSEHSWTGATLLPVLQRYADPRNIARQSLRAFSEKARRLGGQQVSQAALEKLHQAARQSLQFYGPNGFSWNSYALLLREAIQGLLDLQDRVLPLEKELQRLVDEGCSETQKECGLSVPGVGEQSLTAALALCGSPQNWPSFKAIKHFAGAVPVVEESGTTRGTPRMSKLGEPLLRRLIYQLGNNARQWDAEIAALYYHQMVHRGKGHVAAAFAAGLKLLNILRAVLTQQRPYQFRDPQSGNIITKKHSQLLAKTTYRVPEEIRKDRRKQQKRDGKGNSRSSEGHAEALPKAS